MKILSPKMRDIKQLLSSAAGCDRISDYNFRSADEVAAYTNGLDQQVTEITAKLVKASRFVVQSAQRTTPLRGLDLKRLRDSYDLLTELQHKLEILQSLDVTVAHNFKNNRTTLTKSIRTLRKRITTQRDKALNSLEQLAKAHEPVEFKQQVANSVVRLQKRFRKKFKSIREYAYLITGSGDDTIVINHYVELRDLVNDQQDYVYPEYYIVFSAQVSLSGQMTTFVNSLHEFRAPGSFSLGSGFRDDHELLQAIDALLLADEFIDAINRPFLTVKTTDVRIRKLQNKWVDNAAVVNNKLRLTTQPMDKDTLEAVVPELLRDVSNILSSGTVKYKVSSAGQKRWHVDFVVVPKSDHVVMDTQQENLLRDRFNMNDSQIEAVRKLMDKGFV